MACELLHLVGAETLNPHECRGTLRKCQEMRRTGRCAFLGIITFREFRLKRNINEITNANFALCEMKDASIPGGWHEVLYSGLPLLS